jgi:cytidylate kinase
MIRVLTIAREFGSGGAAVASIVADRLKWRLLDREIIDEVVRMAGVEKEVAERCDERLDPVLHRLLKSRWQGGFETSTAEIGKDPFDSESMTRCARAVVEKAAAEGNCVIVGRGAQCILADNNEALHVFLWAPRAWRVRRIRARLPEEKDPAALMDRMDRARAAFIRREFDADWCGHKLYDLVLNTALGDRVAADCIVAAIEGVSSAHA